MKQISLNQKKWLKSIHLVAVGVWITTGLVMFLIHFLADDFTSGEQLQLLNEIIYYIDMSILVPSAILCLLTGWIYSHFTKWGYFKHGWLIFKWIITVSIIVLGTVFSEPWIAKMVQISGELGLEALNDSDYKLYGLSHNILGVAMTGTLIIAVFISVFKPKKPVRN